MGIKTEVEATDLVLPGTIGQESADAIRNLLDEAAAANTTRSYSAALRYWAGWFKARFGLQLTLPVSEAAVIQFLVDHIPTLVTANPMPVSIDESLVAAGLKARVGRLKLSTVLHRIAVLSTAHRLKRLPSPCELPTVRLILKSARRASVKRGERPRKKTAIGSVELAAMLDTCGSSLVDLRDRALLCFGFSSGGRRRSEIAMADMRDLRQLPGDAFIFRLEHSKTHQGGACASTSADKPILGSSARALAEWLSVSGVSVGQIFRSVHCEKVGGPLSPAAVGAIIKSRAKAAGLVGDFAGHSLRSGFVTEASRRGIPLAQIMAMTEHRSISSVLGYVRVGEAIRNPAARLMDDNGNSANEKGAANE